MSYARFSYADVYVFASVHGWLDCCGCWLPAGEQTTFKTTAGMLEHLAKHVAAGHNVPDDTIEALKADAAENDAWMAKVDAGMCPYCDDAGWVQNPPPAWKPCWSCNRDGSKPNARAPGPERSKT